MDDSGLRKMTLEIVSIQNDRDFYACEELQRSIWGFEDISIVPHFILRSVQKEGGIVLGAYDKGQLIGFLWGSPGVRNGKLKHCSMMCGVLPKRRFKGVGYRLKQAQREISLSQGIDLITWTFDPLQSLNAHFNLAKLGALARRYERNFYGEFRDKLNWGLPTDRLCVEWWIDSDRVSQRMDMDRDRSGHLVDYPTIEKIPVINWTKDSNGTLVNVEVDFDRDERRLLLEIPRDLNKMKEGNPVLARRWRRETRDLFERYFRKGYIGTEFLVQESDGRARGFYLLEKVALQKLLQKEHGVAG